MIGVQKMKRHCLVSVHFHGNQTDLIKNKDSWGLVPVYHFPGCCMDPWTHLTKFYQLIIQILWNGFLLSFWYQLFHQDRILHMSWQQSCHDMCKILTWCGNFLPTRYWSWPHQRLVKWAHGFMRNIVSYTVWSRYNMFDSLQNTCNRHSIVNLWG